MGWGGVGCGERPYPRGLRPRLHLRDPSDHRPRPRLLPLAPALGQCVRPGLERGGSRLHPRGVWVAREDRVGRGLVPWGPTVGASGSAFGTEEASVILKTRVYSFVCKVAVLCLFDASSL